MSLLLLLGGGASTAFTGHVATVPPRDRVAIVPPRG